MQFPRGVIVLCGDGRETRGNAVLHSVFRGDVSAAEEAVFLQVGEFVGCYATGNLVILDNDEEGQPAELGDGPDGEEGGVGVRDEGLTDVHREDFTFCVLGKRDR